MDPAVAELLRDLTASGVLVAVFVLMVRGTLMLGSRHEEYKEEAAERLEDMREDRNWWRRTALRALNVGEAAVGRGRGHDDGP